MTLEAEPRADASMISQFLRFATVGAAATALHYATMITLVEAFSLHPVAAATIGFCCGAVMSFFLNRSFTFRHRAAVAPGMVKYFFVVGVGLMVNTAIVAALVHLKVQYVLAQMIATGLVLFWNFFASRLFVFRA